jgi:hypothetical protein
MVIYRTHKSYKGLPIRLPTAAARVRSQVRYVGFVEDELALGQVFSEYFGIPCQFSFRQMLHTHLSFGSGTRGQLVADVPCLTPPKKLHKKLGISLVKLCRDVQEYDSCCPRLSCDTLQSGRAIQTLQRNETLYQCNLRLKKIS